MRLLTNSLFVGAGALLGTQVSLRVTHYLNPRPMPHQLAAILDHPMRMRYRDPGETLALYGFATGMSVLDLGCGTGTFTEEMARMVGADGTVHAVDLQESMIRRTAQRLTAAGLADRVQMHHAGAYELPLPDDTVDLAVVIATMAQIPDRLLALAELQRVLKPGGRLAVSEEMPDPAYAPPGAMRDWLDAAGFQFKGKTGTPFCYSMVAINVK